MGRKSREKAERRESERVARAHHRTIPTFNAREQWRAGHDAELVAIRAAVDAVTSAQLAVAGAVAGAREAGYSWTLISEVLGVSRQAARQRYS